jgi:hypothetical protein
MVGLRLGHLHRNKSGLMTFHPISSSLEFRKACRNIVEICMGLVYKTY